VERTRVIAERRATITIGIVVLADETPGRHAFAVADHHRWSEPFLEAFLGAE